MLSGPMQPLEGWAVVPRTDALLPLWTATDSLWRRYLNEFSWLRFVQMVRIQYMLPCKFRLSLPRLICVLACFVLSTVRNEQKRRRPASKTASFLRRRCKSSFLFVQYSVWHALLWVIVSICLKQRQLSNRWYNDLFKTLYRKVGNTQWIGNALRKKSCLVKFAPSTFMKPHTSLSDCHSIGCSTAFPYPLSCPER